MSSIFNSTFHYLADPFFAFLRSRDVTPQIDFGNFMVGVGTLAVAFVSFYVALRSNRLASRRIVAELREKWLTEFRAKVSEMVAHFSALRDMGILFEDISDQEYYLERIPKIIQCRTHVLLMLNRSEYFHSQFFDISKRMINNSDEIKKSWEKKDLDSIKLLRKEYLFEQRRLVLCTNFLLRVEWKRLNDEINDRFFCSFRHAKRMKKSKKKYIAEDQKLKQEHTQE